MMKQDLDQLVEKYFGHYQSKEVPQFSSPNEEPMAGPEIINIQGSCEKCPKWCPNCPYATEDHTFTSTPECSCKVFSENCIKCTTSGCTKCETGY